jgi:uncharacterized protein (DUF488 family)
MQPIYTVGHSSHAPEHFTSLLVQHGIEVLVDTRSAPYSRFSPQFDREALQDLIAQVKVKYLYLGEAVGGRPRDEGHYDKHGRALYGRMGKDKEFLEAISRIERGADRFRIALLCSEEDPAHCHRRLLVGRVLVERGAELLHIRGKGELQDEPAIVNTSGKLLSEIQPALFAEIDEERWRSTASVLPKNRQPSSLVR